MTNKFIPGRMYKDREGREYMFVGYAPNATPVNQAVFTHGKQVVMRDLQGKATHSVFDILATKDVWVNVYLLHDRIKTSSETYNSEQEAREQCAACLRYLGPHKITVEV